VVKRCGRAAERGGSISADGFAGFWLLMRFALLFAHRCTFLGGASFYFSPV
jgi:hypothetical protein